MATNFLGGGSHYGIPYYRKWVTGRYYGGYAGNMSTTTPTLGLIAWTPLWVPHTVTLDMIGCDASAGIASGVARFGIYTNVDATDLPNALVSGTDVTAAATASGAITAALSVTLSPGLYWKAFVAQTAAATFRNCTGPEEPVEGTVPGVTPNNCYYTTGVTGALPSTATVSAASGAAVRTRVRVA